MLDPVVAKSLLPEQRVERRQWGRFGVDVGKLVVSVAPSDQRNAKVLEESFGGIGVVIDDASGLEPGLDLSLNYEGVLMRGTVRSVWPHEGSRYRVGIEWAPSQSDDLEGHGGKTQIQGRLRILFRMWEAGRWTEMARAVAHLKREAEAMHLEPIVRHAAELLALLDQTPLPATTPQSLVALVDACLNEDEESANSTG
jgi:hypothetical protein